MNIRIATSRGILDLDSVEVRERLKTNAAWTCARCTTIGLADSLKGEFHGDVVVPLCRQHAPRQARTLRQVLLCRLGQLDLLAEERNRLAHEAAVTRRAIRRILAA